ncbi:MAG TPA: hypothetical protein VGR29_11980 [Thermomicrobiales bacterium]|nr:hypothetical protein [Thermomicrobiales bacterium]
MTAILINGLVVLMLLLFAAMALAPLLFSARSTAQVDHSTGEDRVLHVSPVPMIERFRPNGGKQPLPLGKAPSTGDSSRRDAA